VQDLSIGVFGFERFGKILEIAAEAKNQMFVWKEVAKPAQDIRKPGKPGGCVKFEDESVFVMVEDKAGPSIIFAMNGTPARGAWVDDGLASGESLFEVLDPPGFIDGYGVSGMKNADPNGGEGIVKADGQKSVVAVIDDSEFSKLSLTILLTDTIGEKPGMATPQEGFCCGSDPKFETRGGS